MVTWHGDPNAGAVYEENNQIITVRLYEEETVKPDWPILSRSEPWEDEHRDSNPALMMLSAFAVLSVMAGILYLVCMIPWHYAWEGIVWLWDSGPEDSPWLGPSRWGVLAGIACVAWFLVVGLVEWWMKDRR